MSLTSQLKDPSSIVSLFMKERFPNTQEIVRDCRSKLLGAETIFPVASRDRYPYNLIGIAFDYRLRFYFEETPLRNLVAYQGMRLANVEGESETFDYHVSSISRPYNTVARPNIEEFEHRLQETLAKLNPVGRRLQHVQEELLARYCIVLALYETIFRSGSIPRALYLPSTTSQPTVPSVDDLLAIPQPEWLDDLCTLSRVFYDDNTDLFQLPAILNPTFDGSMDVGGADADIIIDDCLIDIKMTINTKLPNLRSWLYQLLGYVLLDYADQYRIRSVAIFLARQRTWLRWPVGDLVDKLSSLHPPLLVRDNLELEAMLTSLRSEFRSVITGSDVPDVPIQIRQLR